MFLRQVKCSQSLRGREIAREDMKSMLYLRDRCGRSQGMHEGGKGEETAKVDRGQMMKLDDMPRGLDSTR